MARKKVEKRELTHEELQSMRVENDWSHLKERLKYIPRPNIIFEVGQKVFIGNLKDCVIDEVYEDGKVYKINYTEVNKNYGNPITTLNCKKIVTWLDVELGDVDSSDLTKKDDIRIHYMQQTISSLFHKVYFFGVDFNPVYQRDHVWELDDKVALIDSIFNNIDIGKFSFIHIDDKKWLETGFSYEVLDGKQRLTALCEFYEGKFTYKGFTFKEMSHRDRNHFESYNVSVGEVSNATEKEIIEYFIKLNTHGRVMDKTHLEKVKKDYLK